MTIERSDWEIAIEQHIRNEYPALRIETNNRSIIPSPWTRSSHLEIDIFIPELSLGIEANGETYHDRDKYTRDLQNSTAYSAEMYKQKYCERVGITLIHVWSSQDMRAIQSLIRDAIEARLADPSTKAWKRPIRTSRLHEIIDIFDPIDLIAIFFAVIPMLLFNWIHPGSFPLWSFGYIFVAWMFYKWVA